jgi:very-short-patch-repair endonuclease
VVYEFLKLIALANCDARKPLRKRNFGRGFVVAVSIGPYFADFACREEKLIVEVDGATHGTEA